MTHIEVDVSGPLADGRALEALDEFREAALDEVAGQGLAEVHHILERSIRQPTPYYETQIRVHTVATSRVVDDRGVIYGPWLEGVGSRNSVTSFKGYHAFRIAAQLLQQQAPVLATHVLQRYLPRMGGS